MLGSWETNTVEAGRALRLGWTLFADGSLAYDLVIDGVERLGSTGTWSLDGGSLREQWIRPDGSRGSGVGTVERVDDHTIHLTIIDNGDAAYNGIVRIYRRRPPVS
jgi:hypothetical protein